MVVVGGEGNEVVERGESVVVKEEEEAGGWRVEVAVTMEERETAVGDDGVPLLVNGFEA